MATVRSFKANVSSVSPSSERMEELQAVRVFKCRKWSYAIVGNMVTRKSRKIGRMKSVRSILRWLRMPISKINFCSIQEGGCVYKANIVWDASASMTSHTHAFRDFQYSIHENSKNRLQVVRGVFYFMLLKQHFIPLLMQNIFQ